MRTCPSQNSSGSNQASLPRGHQKCLQSGATRQSRILVASGGMAVFPGAGSASQSQARNHQHAEKNRILTYAKGLHSLGGSLTPKVPCGKRGRGRTPPGLSINQILSGRQGTRVDSSLSLFISAQGHRNFLLNTSQTITTDVL